MGKVKEKKEGKRWRFRNRGGAQQRKEWNKKREREAEKAGGRREKRKGKIVGSKDKCVLCH